MRAGKTTTGLLCAGAALALLALSAAPAASDTAGQRGGGFALDGGEAVYQGVCQGCHMAQAQGAVGAGSYPALANDPKLASTAYVIHIVLKGHKGMPGFADNLSDQQIADVANYLRSHFGNRFKGEMQAADVQAAR
jgi:mono/diheme cytochrome c family protein